VVIAAGALFATVIVAIVLGIVLTGDSSDALEGLPEVGSVENGLPGAADIDELFAGIPQSGTTLGRPGAPVTLVEYVDLQCPACREFEARLFPELVARWVRTGELRIEMRAWAFIGPDSFRGRLATIAAGRQDKAFNYAALLFATQGPENSGWLNDDMIAKAAASIPELRVRELMDDRDSRAVEDEAAAVDDGAAVDGVDSTPTLFVGTTGTKGTEVELTSLDDGTAIDQAIMKILDRQ
jgi:protein-disulfide isomerase